MNSVLNYIGSKKTLLPFIEEVINDINDDNKIFFDGFSGTGIVGRYLNEKFNFIIHSNDLEYYSYVINYATLKVPYSRKLKKIIKKLNLLKKYKNDKFNLISNNYSPDGENNRMFWTSENANKADAIMEYILTNKEINYDEKIYLTACLLSSLDKVANTSCVYGAFLKKFKKTALKELQLKPIHKSKKIINMDENTIYNMDINNEELLNNKFDIVYLDPPYNERQYSSNYSPLNFICKYNDNIEIYGKTGLIKNHIKSKLCYKSKITQELTEIINKLNAKYILLSYNDEGLLSIKEIKKILRKKGSIKIYKKQYKKFKSNEKDSNKNINEYIFLCIVK